MTGRIVDATDHVARFPELGRVVPEFTQPEVRELVRRPYRIVYRLVGTDEIHILTVHHAARGVPDISQR
jgi:plasmid stabilization system protein ParE